ncbi:MAG: endonuclease III domain-containing protein [Gemmatimonadaceae bacterium]
MVGRARRGTQSTDPTAAEPSLRAKAWAVHQALCEEYRCPIPYFHDLDPVSELVSSLLSHRTRNADSGRAFGSLRARFPTWEDVRDAPTADVERTISTVTWPEQKAPRIQQVLREITRLRGELALDFLGGLTVAEARQWLEALPGVGPKTSAATLLFSTLRMPALPVDSHHHRVARRLGLIPATLAVGPAHAVLAAQLPEGWTARQLYDNHEVPMLHGQRCCYHGDPACGRCVVYALCPTGRRIHPEVAADAAGSDEPPSGPGGRDGARDPPSG